MTATSPSNARIALCAALLVWATATTAATVARGARPQTPGADVDEHGRWINGVTESWWHDPEQFSAGEVAAARALWRRIGAENGGAKSHAWAGDYFVGGETHGTYMRWSPRAGFVIVGVDKCRATVMGLAYGGVALAGGAVEFRPELRRHFGHDGHELKARDHGGAHAAMKYLPVAWRGERLMIGEGEIGDFGDYAAGLGDYNGLLVSPFPDLSHFFHRLGPDAGVAAGETPRVPPGYERFIKRPVEAAITSVGRRRVATDYSVEFTSDIMSFSLPYERASLTTVTVNVGAEHGVKPGTFLRIARPDHGEFVRLTRVGPRSSVGVLARDLDERGRETFYDHDIGGERSYPKVAPGWRLTTEPPR